MTAGIAFADLAPDAPTLGFVEPSSLPTVRERTPQGYLLIRDVVLARTGVQIYHGSEVPIEPGPLGMVEISREPEDLFSAESLRSFENIPVTNEHPRVDGVLTMLNPGNTSQFICGVVRNVRRGEGVRSNYLLGDALLYTQDIIELVEAGKRQVSAGYNAVYHRIEPGRGKQTTFTGNHLAVVHSGRCGAVCSFADHQETPEMTTTPTAPAAPHAPATTVRTVPAIRMRSGASTRSQLLARRLMAAVATGDESYIAEEIDAAIEPEAAAVDPMAAMQAIIDDLKAQIAKLQENAAAAAAAPAAAAEAAAAVESVAAELSALAGEDLPDELVTDAAWRDVISRAEVLAPGTPVPTGDAIATPATRRASIVTHQRRALGAAFDAAPAVMGPIFGVTAKPNLDKMPGLALRGYFLAASDAASRNNAGKGALPVGFTADASSGVMPAFMAGLGFGAAPAAPGSAPKRLTPADINARAAEVWKGR